MNGGSFERVADENGVEPALAEVAKILKILSQTGRAEKNALLQWLWQVAWFSPYELALIATDRLREEPLYYGRSLFTSWNPNTY